MLNLSKDAPGNWRTTPLRLALLTMLTLGTGSAQHHAPPSPVASPYAPQRVSPIRGLSMQEVEDLQRGRGAGYARTAELNSYPGPAHVLELAAQLRLTPQQIARVRAAQLVMDTRARALGGRILEAERLLSAAFQAGTLTSEQLARRTRELGELYGAYRAIHLDAHLAIRPVLTAEQVNQYDQLRGYHP